MTEIKKIISIESVDELLPQTQCQLCNYPGCRPYAEAIVKKGERIDRCLPGGVKTLIELASLLNQDATPYINEMKKKAKTPLVAVIREDECIGCTKCIQACPVDAIIGASKQMHTVIADVCTGCELCIEPCPVDCIDLIKIPERDEDEKKQMARLWRERFEKHERRLEQEEIETVALPQSSVMERQQEISAAIERIKKRKEGPS